ncbi:hypothetical protein ACHAPT_002382 [Fusarium lateritium]
MGLGDLQPEILLQIFGYFCPHCRERHMEKVKPEQWDTAYQRYHRWHLLNLSLVSKHVGFVAQEVLHHHFGYLEEHPEGAETRFPLFCRTISDKPELGGKLRYADLSRLKVDVRRKDVEGWLPGVVDKFRHHLLNKGRHLTARNSLAAAVLLQTPNLEVLHDYGGLEGTVFDQLDPEAVPRDHALPQGLKILWLGDIQSRNVGLSMDLSAKGYGRFLGSLQKLHTLAANHPRYFDAKNMISLQNLRVLQLAQFDMPRTEFEKLIGCTPQLEEFCHLSYFPPYPQKATGATIPEICHVLARKSGTLRRLLLDASCTSDDIGLLAMLTNLEELRISAGPRPIFMQQPSPQLDSRALVRALPPSLRKLHVAFRASGIQMEGEALMEYVSSSFRASPDEQKLKQVYFGVDKYLNGSYVPFKNEIKQKCQGWAKHGTLLFGFGWIPWYEMGPSTHTILTQHIESYAPPLDSEVSVH